MSTKTDNDEIHKALKDVYYEVRIGTAMMILIIVVNLLLLVFLLLGIYMWLDSTPRIG
jgi:uncharacterized iron-regulated membrane protein